MPESAHAPRLAPPVATHALPAQPAAVGAGGLHRLQLAGGGPPAATACSLRDRRAHRAPAAEPAGGAARRHHGHAGAAAACCRCGCGGQPAQRGIAPAPPPVGVPANPGRAAALGPQRVAARAAGRAGSGRGHLTAHGSRSHGGAEPARRPLLPGAGRHASQLRAAHRPAHHHPHRRVAHGHGRQPGARDAGAWRHGLCGAARPGRPGQRHPHLRLSQTAGRREPAAGRSGPPQRGPARTALVAHAGLVPADGHAVGRRPRPVAPARGAPAGRRAAAPGPGRAAEHAGRTGRRHGARVEPAADRAALQHAGRPAPAGR